MEALPFKRGDTFFGIGPTDTITTAMSDSAQHLLGKRYRVTDDDYNGQMVELMVVQYDGTGSLTAADKCVEYVDAASFFKKFKDQAPASAGTVSHPLDHKYDGKTIRDLDLCYVVTHGPCECEFGGTVTAGANVAVATDGQLVGAAAGDDYVVGISIDTGAADTTSTVFVGVSTGIE